MDIPIELPLDADHFLRRECPSCTEELKWHHGPTDDRPEGVVDPPQYTCPLCGQRANHDQWFTQEQIRYQHEAVEFYAPDAIHAELKKAFGQNYTPGRNNAPAPTPLYEPDDMIIIEPPCHPWEPVKVPEERADAGPLFCLICGESYSA